MSASLLKIGRVLSRLEYKEGTQCYVQVKAVLAVSRTAYDCLLGSSMLLPL